MAVIADETVYWGMDLLLMLTVPALILLNGLFVASEFSLVAIRKTRIEEMIRRGVVGARSVEAAVSHIDRIIASTQLGITLASIGLGFVGEPALARLIMPLFSYLPDSWHAVASHSLAGLISFVLITYMHVIFGELIPKTLALQMPDSTALWIVRPLMVFVTLSRPFIVIINGSARILLRSLGLKTEINEAIAHSIEELLLLIEDTEEAGLLDADQANLVENVFRLSDKTVQQCMIPRDKMAALELNTPSDKILEAVRSGAHTRMPVYENDIDNIVGIVNTKDLFYLFSLQGVVVLMDAIYPALYLYPDESMDNALRLFRKARRPMALVRDESGHIHGVITLEDVLEEIIGDIEDEHDHPPPRKISPRRRPALAIQKNALIRSGMLGKVTETPPVNPDKP
jgi:CBS domain containing-hemolysin-like protein